MRNGFLRGIFIGSVIGAAATTLMKPENLERAKEVLSQGSHIFKSAEDNIETATSWIEKGRNLFQDEEPVMQTAQAGAGVENIDSRVAFLEKRLEELEHKGV